MTFKDILVYLDPTPDGENRLAFAVSMAEQHGARLIGIDASSEDAFDKDWRDRTAAIGDLFREAAERSRIPAEFHTETGARAHGPHRYAHCVDLIIAPRPEFESRRLVIDAVPKDILLGAGVPVLLLPYGWKPEPVGKNIVLAWNASREATRAMHDAMPLLQQAEVVTVFTFSSGRGSVAEEQRIVVDHLHRHGVPARASSWEDTGQISPIEALYASLDTAEADLIVAGAYGHSPMLEGLLGGASQELIEGLSLPVLMSH
ncbi:universal stress protein [Labrys monachus]|uniref:Nucleotide-binding universal stress UspA family protein n=1 Tax=Labrys monachus TaxID=217067 RepID=A0ABU0F8Z9_9HYPH|nr:universal stress protein [Labrys monachus]MDQ0391091.1 nucleotide-binding universal stress UspA family protein [Labrys monachus]